MVEEEALKKVKRELGLQDCFPLPMSHGEAQARGTPHYYTAELPPSSLPEASPFTVGDNHTYNGYWNSPLNPRKSYLVYFQAMSNFKGVSEETPARDDADLTAFDHQPVNIKQFQGRVYDFAALILWFRLQDSWHCPRSQPPNEYFWC